METVLLVLDFLCPLFFFFLGRSQKGLLRRILVRESLVTFLLALLLAPAALLWCSLTVQGIVTAGLFCTQFLLLAKASCRISQRKLQKR
ncbi:MAG: hypothetical protein IKJ74_04690 [Clostridia bacterium]|nr:hypothetical protein [Clostridia bacterium]